MINAAEDYAVRLEAKTLDKVQDVLSAAPGGLTARQIADKAGIGIGYLQALLKKSTAVIRRKGPRWVLDLKDLPARFHPQPAVGAGDPIPKAKRGRAKLSVTSPRARETNGHNEAANRPPTRAKKRVHRATENRSPGRRGPGRPKGSGRIRPA